MTRLGTVLVALLLATGCVSPSRTNDDYRNKVANTAEAFVSALGSAKLGADAARDGKVFGPYLSRLVAEAEDDALAAETAIDAVQPPSAYADSLYSALDNLMKQALDLLRAVRVAARRGDRAAVVAKSSALGDLADRLDQFSQDPKP